MRGYLYIFSNRAMPNLLKVGYTTRTVEERIRELSTTGVPGVFVAEFYCEIDNAPGLEKAVHSRLSSHRYDKEFFRCNVELAVRVSKETLLEKGYSVFDSGGRSSHAYITDQEKAAIKAAENALRQKEAERRKQEIAEKNEKEKQKKNAQDLEQRFMQLAPLVNKIIKDNRTEVTAIRGIASFLMLLTIVGMSLADKLDPPAYDDGVNISKKLSSSDILTVRKLFDVMQELRSQNLWSETARRYDENTKGKGNFLICFEYGRYNLSSWAQGVFHGLGMKLMEIN
jgi:hypothetical protein